MGWCVGWMLTPLLLLLADFLFAYFVFVAIESYPYFIEKSTVVRKAIYALQHTERCVTSMF